MESIIKSKKIILSDMDDTLCKSCQSISSNMKNKIEELVKKEYLFAVIGGSTPENIFEQVARHLSVSIYVIGNSGTKISKWNSKKLIELFTDDFSKKSKEKIINELEKLSEKFNLIPFTSKQDQILNRGTQITFTILGRNAPFEIKKAYDPDKSKRKKFVEFLNKSLPEFQLTIGGTTSIDITKKGRNKGWGIKNFCKLFDYKLEDCIFFGDGIFPGGNDYSVRGVVDYIKVKNPEETLKYFNEF